jgi:hypothetical protein
VILTAEEKASPLQHAEASVQFMDGRWRDVLARVVVNQPFDVGRKFADRNGGQDFEGFNAGSV